MIIFVQIVLVQNSISSEPLRSLTTNPVGQWSSQFYYRAPTVPSTDFIYLCENWYDTESNNQNVGTTLLNMAVSCPARKELALLQNSGLREIRKESFLRNTNYHTQWLNYFHPGAESCFKQSAVERRYVCQT